MKKRGLSKDYKHLKYLLDKGMDVVAFVRILPFRKHTTIATSGTENGRKFYKLGYGFVYEASFFRQCVALELEYVEPENCNTGKNIIEGECCGSCCWFKHEDTDGMGVCYRSKYEIDYHIGDEGFPRCNQAACDKYVSNEEQRHYMAVLLQANRYRRDNNVPAIYRMPDPKDFGLAIDFAVKYMRVFEKL